MKIIDQYRQLASDALQRAKAHLESNDTERLLYAALELRMAMESIVYGSSTRYKGELPEEALNTWQPKQLLDTLLSIDPYADKGGALSFGKEKEYGVPPDEMTYLGSEKVISLSEIKKYYQKISSYIHTPIPKNLNFDPQLKDKKLLAICEEIVKMLDEVFESRLFNIDIKQTMKITCMRCNEHFIRRVPLGVNEFEAQCINCLATYHIKKQKNENEYTYQPKGYEVKCGNKSCPGLTHLWVDEWVVGTVWVCDLCQGENKVALGIAIKK